MQRSPNPQLPFGRRTTLTLLVAVLATTTPQAPIGAGPGNAGRLPYARVKGKRIDIRTVEKSSANELRLIRQRYHDALARLIRKAARRQMIALAAREAGLTPEAYRRRIRSRVSAPTKQQIRTKYNELRQSGRLPSGSFSKNRDKIRAYLLHLGERAAMDQEYARLKRKYRYALVEAPRPRARIALAGEPTTGPSSAPVIFVEFGDFRCGYCGILQGTKRKLRKIYGNRIRWVFKDSPFQPGSRRTHAAANCVLRQNAAHYWTYFDGLYRSPTSDVGELRTRAGRLGLNLTQYDSCLKDPAIGLELDQDLNEGRRLGIQGTPAVFINGIVVEGAQPLRVFRALIDKELKRR